MIATGYTALQIPLRLMRKAMHSPLDTLAMNLRHILDARDRSARNVGAKADISNKTVSNILNAARSVQIGNAAKVADEVGVPLWQLLCPHFPRVHIDEKRLAELIENYVGADEEGKRFIERAASSQPPAHKQDSVA